MSYLLDTNVLSELRKGQIDKNVKSWVTTIPDELLYISVISIGEIKKGIEILQSDSTKKEVLLNWLEYDVILAFGKRILTIDTMVILQWGNLIAQYRALPSIDSLIAATALAHHLTVVTRNIKDFETIIGLKTLNPWGQ